MRTFPGRKSSSSGEKRSGRCPSLTVIEEGIVTLRGTYLKHTEKKSIVREDAVNGARCKSKQIVNDT